MYGTCYYPPPPLPTTTPDTRQFFVAPHEKKLYSDRNIFKGHCMIYGFVFN